MIGSVTQVNVSSTQIMNDNLMYLNEWQKYNDALKEKLQIVGPNLVCDIEGKMESVDISNYYLPDILYNPDLREDLSDASKINAEDLFHIIKVNILAEEFEAENFKTGKIVITKFTMPKDEWDNEIIIFEDNQGHKYRLTKNIPEVKAVYLKLAFQKEPVDLEEFKKELEVMRHE